jgi:type I restriction enzyme S subunit
MSKSSEVWRETTIDAISKKIAMGPFGSDIKTDNFVTSGVPVIRGQNLTSGRFNGKEFVFLTEEKANQLGNAVAFPGDLVFTHRGTLGQVGLIPNHPYPRYVVSQSQMRLQCDPSLVLPEFLYYYFKSRQGQHALLANTSQTGVPAISRPVTSLKAIKLRIPGIEQQLQITNILGTLDDKIELNQRMAATLEEMARSIFKSWFIDFDPVRAKSEGRPTGLPSDIDALFPDEFEESEMGLIPRGWNIGSIAEVATICGGGTPSTKNPEYWDGDLAWATPKDLSKLSQPVLLTTERSITESGLKSISSGLYPAGTVLMSSRAPIGYLAIAEIPIAVNQGFIALLPKVKCGNLFLLSCRSIETVLPDREIIEAFGRLIDPFYRRLVTATRESLSLATIRDCLLPKLISGELLLPELGVE